MRNLNAISSGSSSVLFLKEGFGTWNTASVSVEWESATAGTWRKFADATAKTADFQYTIDTGDVPINVRITIDSGAPTGTLACEGDAGRPVQ